MNTALRHPSQGLPPGTRLGEFELHGLLGAGGFGMVYRAYDHSLHRTVAIKEYLPGGLADRAGQAVTLRTGADARRFQEGLRSFMNEARLLAQFDHPALVKVLRVWEQNHTAYMAMPLYQGVTLKEACAQMRMPPPEPWLRKLLWSVLQALELLHRRDTVHRDISPDNIFLQDIGPPVLLDLGAARQALGQDAPQHTAILKVNYAPIEQYADAQDMRQGPWSDVYALAAVVYGCLNRAPPVPASVRVLRDSLRPPAELVEDLRSVHGLAYTPALVTALTAGLALDPQQRPRDLAAFGALLQLQPAPGMERFDWRAELGPGWQAPHPATDGPPEDDEMSTLWQAPQRHGAVDMTLPAPVDPPATGWAGRRHWWTKAGVAALIVGLLAAVGIVASPGDPPPGAPPPVPSIAPAKAAAPVAVTAPPPVPAPMPPEPMPPEELVEPVAPPVRPPVVRRSPSPAAPRALSAEQICPDSNFFTRPMCLFRACQQAPYAAMPVCVENARHLRENQRAYGP